MITAVNEADYMSTAAVVKSEFIVVDGEVYTLGLDAADVPVKYRADIEPLRYMGEGPITIIRMLMIEKIPKRFQLVQTDIMAMNSVVMSLANMELSYKALDIRFDVSFHEYKQAFHKMQKEYGGAWKCGVMWHVKD